jgi:hypothetical protein
VCGVKLNLLIGDHVLKWKTACEQVKLLVVVNIVVHMNIFHRYRVVDSILFLVVSVI